AARCTAASSPPLPTSRSATRSPSPPSRRPRPLPQISASTSPVAQRKATGSRHASTSTSLAPASPSAIATSASARRASCARAQCSWSPGPSPKPEPVARLPQWMLVFWPYVLSALVVALWLAILWRRIDRKLQFVIVAFVACAVANMAIEFVCVYLVPLDVAGTPPPDIRNVHLRFLITAAVQAPVALGLAYYIAARTRVDRWQQP